MWKGKAQCTDNDNNRGHASVQEEGSLKTRNSYDWTGELICSQLKLWHFLLLCRGPSSSLLNTIHSKVHSTSKAKLGQQNVHSAVSHSIAMVIGCDLWLLDLSWYFQFPRVRDSKGWGYFNLTHHHHSARPGSIAFLGPESFASQRGDLGFKVLC